MSILLLASAVFVLALAVVVWFVYAKQAVKGDTMYLHVVFAALFVAGIEVALIADAAWVGFLGNLIGCVAMLIAIARFRR